MLVGLRFPAYSNAMGMRAFWRTEELKEDLCYVAPRYADTAREVMEALRRPTRAPEGFTAAGGAAAGARSRGATPAPTPPPPPPASGRGGQASSSAAGAGDADALLALVPVPWPLVVLPTGPTPEELARKAEVKRANAQRLRRAPSLVTGFTYFPGNALLTTFSLPLLRTPAACRPCNASLRSSHRDMAQAKKNAKIEGKAAELEELEVHRRNNAVSLHISSFGLLAPASTFSLAASRCCRRGWRLPRPSKRRRRRLLRAGLATRLRSRRRSPRPRSS